MKMVVSNRIKAVLFSVVCAVCWIIYPDVVLLILKNSAPIEGWNPGGFVRLATGSCRITRRAAKLAGKNRVAMTVALLSTEHECAKLAAERIIVHQGSNIIWCASQMGVAYYHSGDSAWLRMLYASATTGNGDYDPRAREARNAIRGMLNCRHGDKAGVIDFETIGFDELRRKLGVEKVSTL